MPGVFGRCSAAMRSSVLHGICSHRRIAATVHSRQRLRVVHDHS